ncbi:MAG: 16S rRNA (cytosine(967)-C(5))-methyltransferase RsmB [Gammaproteobacteria bacterium]|nr:16S rRNA (cytosine(967)-C(5))-methyltransferase RsmB [Gammaproteobacteria bacterium]
MKIHEHCERRSQQRRKPNSDGSMNIRAIAAIVVGQVLQQKQSLDVVLPEYLAAITQAKDRALLQEICYGVIRFYFQFDYLLHSLLKSNPQKTDPVIYALLLVGLYQLNYLRIPEHAAIFETVEATKQLKKFWATKLVNAVLRNFLREKTQLLAKIEQNEVAYYAHPKWLIAELQKSWPLHWQKILLANNEKPPMHLRVNLKKNSRDDYLQKLAESKIIANAAQFVVTGITLTKPEDVSLLPDFQAGAVSVQDLSAQVVPELLDLMPGQRMLDACAAPGGKLMHILETEHRLADVVGLDNDPLRLEKVAENLKRAELSAKLICGDASHPDSWWDGKKFARILLDAPCSGTGVIRRHPDIKILRRAKDIENLAKRQQQILSAIWPLLEDNGLLVYVTCSVLPQENVDVVSAFLAAHSDTVEKKFVLKFGMPLKYGWQILPENMGGDGFYFAVLLKKTAKTQ